MIKMSFDHCSFLIFVLRIIFFFLFFFGDFSVKMGEILLLQYIHIYFFTYWVVKTTKVEDPMCKLIHFRFSFPANKIFKPWLGGQPNLPT